MKPEYKTQYKNQSIIAAFELEETTWIQEATLLNYKADQKSKSS